MLSTAFSGGVSEHDYVPLLTLLVEEMSLKNVAEVLSYFEEREWGTVYNDALGVAAGELNAEETDRSRVVKLLETHGYRRWLEEA